MASQGNYAAANAALDGWAHRQQCAGNDYVSVQWGAWATGMASRHGRKNRQMVGGQATHKYVWPLWAIVQFLLASPCQGWTIVIKYAVHQASEHNVVMVVGVGVGGGTIIYYCC
jgi:KR domain